MALSPGRLRHRLDIRRKTKEKDPSNGDYVTAWQDVATIWAEVLGLAGRESVMAQALQGVSVYKITIRYRRDITDADQLRYGAIDLNIRSISDPDGMREQLLIIADTESVENG